VKHRSHSLQRKAYICELAGSAAWLRSLRRTVRVIVAVAPFVCQIAVSALFEPDVRAQTVSRLSAIDRFAKFIHWAPTALPYRRVGFAPSLRSKAVVTSTRSLLKARWA
jgi:hypothetical protein